MNFFKDSNMNRKNIPDKKNPMKIVIPLKKVPLLDAFLPKLRQLVSMIQPAVLVQLAQPTQPAQLRQPEISLGSHKSVIHSSHRLGKGAFKSRRAHRLRFCGDDIVLDSG